MRYLVPLGFLLASTTVASAADFGGPTYDGSVKDGPVAMQYNWSGLYVGGHVGWATGGWDGEACTSGACPGNIWEDPSIKADFDGFLGGLQAGWNRQHGSFVWGLEADVSWGDLSGTSTLDTIGDGDEFVRWTDKFSIDAFGTVRARLGFLVTPSLLLYGTGGLAWALTEMEHTSEHLYEQTPQNNKVTGRGSSDEAHIGWVAGAGGEYMLAPNWTVRAEWLHVDLGDAHYHAVGHRVSGGEPVPGKWATDQVNDTDLEFDVFRLGVNYKFGG